MFGMAGFRGWQENEIIWAEIRDGFMMVKIRDRQGMMSDVCSVA